MAIIKTDNSHYTNIANTIRSRIGTETQFKPSEMPQGVESVFTAGYEKGKAEGGTSKAEQEKLVTITENGTTEVLPDEGKTLSKVNVEVNVPNDDSKLIWLISRNVEEIVIPYGTVTVGTYAFYNYKILNKCKIPNTVTTIGSSAFEGCTVLAEVSLPNSLKSISTFAFRYCDSITDIIIPYGVTNIGFGAFQGCDLLESLYIPATVTSLPKAITTNCGLLTNLTIECEIKTTLELQTNSKLTVESAKTALIRLTNYKGTPQEGYYTIYLHSDTWALLDLEGETSPDGTTWAVYVDNKGWNY